MTPYISYPNVQGIIYQDELSRNGLMRTDELHKFSNGTLNPCCLQTLQDMATGEFRCLFAEEMMESTRQEESSGDDKCH
ncbi:hypothetical protein Tco_0731870 [Tanacetum coccineum]